ncbi:MAG: hypothetical protein Kow0059_07200 [Candidatus Sumerlaeia bacterium]
MNRFNPTPRFFVLTVVLLAVLAAALFGGAMWQTSGGHLMAPLDDTFILANYAKNLSRGYWFHYNAGEGYSAGTTSFLYPLLLAPFFWMGLSGVRILLVTFSIGVLGLIVTALALARSGELLGSPRAGRWAALLFLLNGHAGWGYLCGMETALFGTLIILALVAFQNFFTRRDRASLYWALAAVALATLTRLEGAVLVAGLWVLVAVRARERSLPPRLAMGAAVLAVPPVLIIVMNAALSQSWSTNTVAAKSLFTHPYYTVWDMAGRWARNLVMSWAGHFSNTIAEPLFRQFRGEGLWPIFPPLTILLFFTGAIWQLAREWSDGRPAGGALLVLWTALLLGAICLVDNPFVHNYRYFVPLTPLVLLGVALGAERAGEVLRQARVDAGGALAATLIVLSAPSVLFWAREYGENTSDIFNQHRRLSWWVQDATPPDSLLGVTDAGLIPYYTDRRVFDFVGLVSNEQARYWREGPGTTFERLENFPPGQLPDFIITYSYLWGEPHFLGRRVYQTELTANSVTSGKALEVWKPDWRILNSGGSPLSLEALRGGWKIVDNLDVADLDSERAHAYIWRQDAERLPPDAWPPRANLFFIGEYPAGIRVADAGRAVSGFERFRMKARPGVPSRLLLRTDAAESKTLRIRLNGSDAGRWVIPQASSAAPAWREEWFDLPADSVKQSPLEIEVLFEWDHSWEQYHRSFHYWLLQQDSSPHGD